MSSLLLNRLSRLCLTKQPALGVKKYLCGARFLSETSICRIVRADHCHYSPRDESVSKLVIRNVKHGSDEEVLEKMVPTELMTGAGTIGASHGWVATLKERVVCLQDDLNPRASDSDPKRISLPRLETLPHCQTQLVTNVAMSSSSPEDEDCILAVKFVGPQLSLCRPAEKDKKWVNIRIEDPGFFNSRVMYSKRDEMFAMPAYGGTHIGYWDLGENLEKPKVCRNHFDTPQLLQSEWEELDLCCTIEELVESRSTQEMFMIKRFRKRNNKKGGRMEEHQMWVFKQGLNPEQWCYTNDIGDLCIFLSKSEPFCLNASSHQKCPNSIYFIDKSERGIFTLGDKCKTSNFSNFTAPYFIPPQSYLNANCSNGSISP